MKTYTAEEIVTKVKQVWKDLALVYYWEIEDLDVSVSFSKDCTAITLSKMYSAPGLNFEALMALSEFFGTKNINDDDRFYSGGCETCDYGSSYGFTLSIRPE